MFIAFLEKTISGKTLIILEYSYRVRSLILCISSDHSIAKTVKSQKNKFDRP